MYRYSCRRDANVPTTLGYRTGVMRFQEIPGIESEGSSPNDTTVDSRTPG